jgi:nucleoside-diphosphate-sugar epimerase
MWSFVHIEDAAAATVDAVERGAPSVYRVVDDDPAPLREWLPVAAPILGREGCCCGWSRLSSSRGPACVARRAGRGRRGRPWPHDGRPNNAGRSCRRPTVGSRGGGWRCWPAAWWRPGCRKRRGGRRRRGSGR